MVLHAEDNALLFAGDRFRENNHYHIYTYPFMPCPKCMAKIIQHAEYYNFFASIHAPVNLSPREEAYEKSFDLTIDLVDNMKYKRLDIVLYELPSWEI